jgi:hypothetical protein
LIAGLFWGTSPVLVKRGLVNSDVSAATLYQQATILATLLGAALLEGDLFAGKIAPLAILIFPVRALSAPISAELCSLKRGEIGASRAIFEQFFTAGHRALGRAASRRAPHVFGHDRRGLHHFRRVFRCPT